MIIFLGGSRNLAFVPEEVQDRLDSWIHTGAHFLIGDANGADSALQEFLASRGHRQVTVFSSATHTRNNKGSWPEERVDSGLKSNSADRHTVKDRRMVKQADKGLVIWDQESIGTLANIVDLVRSNKPVVMFDSRQKELWILESRAEFESWSQAFLPEVGAAEKVEAAEKRLERYRKREEKKEKNSQSNIPDDRLF